MKLKLLLFILIFSFIINVSAYTPPNYTSVNLSLASSYSSPNYTSVNLSFTDTSDITSPNASLIFPANNSFNKTALQNFTFNVSDETGLQKAVFYVYNQSGLFNSTTVTYIVNTLFYTVGVPITLIDGIYNWFIEVFDLSNNSYKTGNFTITSDLTLPSVSNLIWKTTGGFTTNSLILNQIINEINVTASDSYMQNCYLTIIDSDSIPIASNSLMINTSTVYTYTTLTSLNKAGNWNISINCNDTSNNIATISSIISVSTTNLSLISNWYGYAPQKILNSTEIIDNSAYQFMLYEFEQNITNLSTSWTNMKTAINNSYNQNVKVGLNYILDYNINTSTLNTAALMNISLNLKDLTTAPYTSTVEYISLEILNPSSYNTSQKDSVFNSLATNITSTVNNKFVVFSKNYNSTGLTTSVIQSTTLLYSEPTSQTDFINKEISMFKNNVSLNRIYEGVSDSLKTDLSSYYTNVLKVLRSTPNKTTISNGFSSVLNNGDILVFNNQTNALININVSEVTGDSLKDAWDSTNNYLIEANSDLNFTVNISSYSATIIYFEDLDHIQMDSLISAKVYKGASSTSSNFNYSYSGTRTGNFALYGANDFTIELFDPNYIKNNFITYYGWINASSISRDDFCSYGIMILADKNNGELDSLIANCTSSEVYVYISVADYSNGDQANWYVNKTTEVDTILALNGSLNIFVDGLDSGIGGSNFTSRMKDLVDYIQVTKNRKAILNTYTAYETFATLGNGGVMKESCVNRWNGIDAANPTNYSRESWSLELNKSKWYNSHNVKVLCQSFSNRTIDGTFVIKNYTELQDIYFASKVLGYNYFYLSQPDFNYAYLEYLYNVGTDLSFSWETGDNQTYYRKYSNGIVYYNSTSEHGWADDGRIINNATVCFDIYDAHANAVNFKFTINNPQSEGDNGDYTIPDSNMTLFDWKNVCIDVTGTTNGRYLIEGWVSPRTTIVGQGLNIGYTTNSTKSKHSYYDSSTTDSWIAYDYGQDWNVDVLINDTKKTSIDATNQITQLESNNSGRYFMNLSSDYSFPIEIWSNPFNVVNSTLKALYYKNSTNGWSNISVLNTTTCNTNAPLFSSTTIDLLVHKACYTQSGSNLVFRIASPSLSTRQYYLDTDVTNPTASLVYPSNNSFNSTTSQNFTISGSDNMGLNNGTLFIYNQSGIYNTSNFNFVYASLTDVVGVVVNIIQGIYKWWVQVFDLADNSYTTINNTLTIDTTNPSINLTYPLNTSYSIVLTSINFTVSDTNLATCWYSVNGGLTNTSTSCTANVTGLTANQGSNSWLVGVNDSANNKNTSIVTFFVDSINPTINFTAPTLNSGITKLQDFVYINTTWTEANFKNITFKLFNLTSQVNSTSFVVETYNFNFTNLTVTTYFYNVTICDILSNCNSTETRNITLISDNTPPTINITYPLNDSALSFPGFVNVTLNVSANDSSGISSYWYNIENGDNVTFYNGTTGIHFAIPDGQTWTRTVYVFVNDTYNNVNSSSVYLTISQTAAPGIGGSGEGPTSVGASLNLIVSTEIFRTTATFNVLASENLRDCSVTINSWKTENNMTIKGDTANYIFSNLTPRDYLARFRCKDINGVINDTEKAEFNIFPKDKSASSLNPFKDFFLGFDCSSFGKCVNSSLVTVDKNPWVFILLAVGLLIILEYFGVGLRRLL